MLLIKYKEMKLPHTAVQYTLKSLQKLFLCLSNQLCQISYSAYHTGSIAAGLSCVGVPGWHLFLMLFLHSLITSTVTPLNQQSETEAKTQWTPRKAETCPYKAVFFHRSFSSSMWHSPAMCLSWELASPFMHEEFTFPCEAWLSSQCLLQRLWMLCRAQTVKLLNIVWKSLILSPWFLL